MTGETGSGTDVYILGAGFSRAVSSLMPITDQLGTRCLEIIGSVDGTGRPANGFTGGQFESWLSRISEDQPYLSAARNAQNRALFLSVSDAIHNVLREATLDALDQGWPDWLPAILRLAHYGRDTLISFNYDELVECAVSGNAVLPQARDVHSVSVGSITGNVPASATGAPAAGLSWGGPAQSETFRLLKLHGSLNWYWVDGDTSGTSLLAGPLPGTFGAPRPVTPEALRERVPGRVPFIVPPASTKSRYFGTPVVRQIWSDAFQALRRAERITFVGYSLPLEDGTFAGLLSTALRERTDVRVGVADYRAESVIKHLQALELEQLVDENDIHPGPSSVADMVRARVSERAGQVLADLALRIKVADLEAPEPLQSAGLLVEFDRFLVSGIEVMQRVGDVVVLTAAEPAPPGQVLAHATQAEQWPRASEFEPLLDGAARVEVRTPNARYSVYDYRVIDSNQYSSGPWLALSSATTPRRGQGR